MKKVFFGGFCPRCGKKEERLFFGFCFDCLVSLGRVFFVPSKIDLELCAKCERFFLQGKWVGFSQENVLKLVELNSKLLELKNASFFVKDLEIGQKNANAFIVLKGELENESVLFEKSVVLRFLRVSCPFCSRLAGNYFEAIIQVRFRKQVEKKTISEKLKELVLFFEQFSKNDALAKIVKTEFLPNGFNAWIGSKKAAKKAARFFSKQLTEPVKFSFKLHGWDKTKNRPMKRDTYLLRF